MKLVINRCYGGFGLSDEAVISLSASECKHIARHEPIKHYGGRPGWEKRFADQRARQGMFSVLVIDGKIVTDEHRYTDRGCPDLVRIVEEMGAKASGHHAWLEVVDIPDGVTFEIDEYDGIETVEEAHRSWP